MNILPALLFLFVLAVGLVSLGLIIGSFMESPQGFGLVSSLLAFPMFLLSGALYPLSALSGWMYVATYLNPVSYAVDGLRGVLFGSSSMPIGLDFSVVAAFAMTMVIVGTWAFNRMKV